MSIEANPVEGMATMVAICDYDAGYDLGVWVGKNVNNADDSPLRILDVGLPWFRPCLLRSEGFVEGVRSVQPMQLWRLLSTVKPLRQLPARLPMKRSRKRRH